jgi:hypothetical protein
VSSLAIAEHRAVRAPPRARSFVAVWAAASSSASAPAASRLALRSSPAGTTASRNPAATDSQASIDRRWALAIDALLDGLHG